MAGLFATAAAVNQRHLSAEEEDMYKVIQEVRAWQHCSMLESSHVGTRVGSAGGRHLGRQAVAREGGRAPDRGPGAGQGAGLWLPGALLTVMARWIGSRMTCSDCDPSQIHGHPIAMPSCCAGSG